MNWRGRHGPLRLPDSGSAPILKLQAMVECTESLLKKTGACGHGSTARLRLEVASHSLDERKKANSIMQGGGTLNLIRSWAAAYHVHTEFEVESSARNDMDGTNLFQDMLASRKMRLSAGWNALQRLACEKPAP